MYTPKQVKAIEKLNCTAVYFLGKRDVWLSKYTTALEQTTVGDIQGKNAGDHKFAKLMALRMFSDDNNKLFQLNM